MSAKEYTCNFCLKQYFRYPSQRTGKESYCSRECKSNAQKELLKGINNPNYKTGIHNQTICSCGNRKDYRAEKCSKCNGVSFPKNLKTIPDELKKIIKETLESSINFVDAKHKLEQKEIFISRKKLHIFQINENINISHFSFCQYRNIPNEILFNKNKARHNTLKKRILKENLIPYKCSECTLEPVWNNKILTLQLDHINGDNTDNRLENLRFLCPNCHSQTETFCSKNFKGQYIKEV